METAIQVVWWIGLIGAVIATLIILQEVVLVLGTLNDIHRLAQFTRDAARGIAVNMGAVSRLAALDDPGRRMREGAGALSSAAAAMEQKLDTLAG